jgi:hypothetical protein
MIVESHAEMEHRSTLARRRAPPLSLAIPELLTHFFVAAVGMRLLEPIEEFGTIRARLMPQPTPVECDPAVWAAWMTNAGPLYAWGAIDRAQSHDLNVHVLFIEWWRPTNTHHLGWWRCDPKRPTEWTLGRGS